MAAPAGGSRPEPGAAAGKPGAGMVATPASAGSAAPRIRRGPPWLGLLALVISIAGLLALWQWSQKNIEELARRVQDADLRSTNATREASQVVTDLRDLRERTEAAEARLTETTGQQARLEKLYRSVAADSADALLADLESALGLAAQQLASGGSAEGALLALQSADGRLARLDDPALAGIRQAIGRDMERLRSATGGDIGVLAARLDTIASAIDDWPIAGDALDAPVTGRVAEAGKGTGTSSVHEAPASAGAVPGSATSAPPADRPAEASPAGEVAARASGEAPSRDAGPAPTATTDAPANPEAPGSGASGPAATGTGGDEAASSTEPRLPVAGSDAASSGESGGPAPAAAPAGTGPDREPLAGTAAGDAGTAGATSSGVAGNPSSPAATTSATQAGADAGPAAAPAVAATGESAAASGDLPAWGALVERTRELLRFDRVRDQLSTLFRVRRIDQPEAALIAPDQAYFLRENLRLRLLNARLALLSRNDPLFRSDVAQAIAWIERYFERGAPEVRRALAQLEQVAQARTIGQAPSVNDSLGAVRVARAAREGQQ